MGVQSASVDTCPLLPEHANWLSPNRITEMKNAQSTSPILAFGKEYILFKKKDEYTISIFVVV